MRNRATSIYYILNKIGGDKVFCRFGKKYYARVVIYGTRVAAIR